MTIDISAIARAVSKQAAADDISIKLGHALELVAACLGYTSLSALQTAQAVGSELRNFHKARHVVIDLDLARCRALALGHSALAGSLQELLSVAFSTRSKWAEVHTDFKIFEEALKRMVGQQMLADPDVLASIGGAYMEDRFNICIDDSLVAGGGTGVRARQHDLDRPRHSKGGSAYSWEYAAGCCCRKRVADRRTVLRRSVCRSRQTGSGIEVRRM